MSDLTDTFLDPAENNQGEPVWSPDGTQIAFDNDSNDPARQGVYLMNADAIDDLVVRSRPHSVPIGPTRVTPSFASAQVGLVVPTGFEPVSPP